MLEKLLHSVCPRQGWHLALSTAVVLVPWTYSQTGEGVGAALDEAACTCGVDLLRRDLQMDLELPPAWIPGSAAAGG